MKKKDSLLGEYYTLINNLPRLSQKEIEALYERENISYTEIKELEDEC